MKFAICNELFEGWSFERVCTTIREIGYTGIEVAPFTLAPLITDFPAEQRRELRRIADQADVKIIGLHWLLAKTEGFQLTSPDPGIRAKTATYLSELARCTADLGGTLMVFGSPAARKIPAGHSRQQAEDFAVNTLEQILPVLSDTGVSFLLEPLSSAETDFMLSADEAEVIRKRLDHPRIGIHLDVKAMSAEVPSEVKETPAWSKAIADVIRKHHRQTGHFHANDPNLRGPGMGKVTFEPIFVALREVEYSGWISVEVFDFKPDPVTIALESHSYMADVWQRVND